MSLDQRGQTDPVVAGEILSFNNASDSIVFYPSPAANEDTGAVLRFGQ